MSGTGEGRDLNGGNEPRDRQQMRKGSGRVGLRGGAQGRGVERRQGRGAAAYSQHRFRVAALEVKQQLRGPRRKCGANFLVLAFSCGPESRREEKEERGERREVRQERREDVLSRVGVSGHTSLQTDL